MNSNCKYCHYKHASVTGKSQPDAQKYLESARAKLYSAAAPRRWSSAKKSTTMIPNADLKREIDQLEQRIVSCVQELTNYHGIENHREECIRDVSKLLWKMSSSSNTSKIISLWLLDNVYPVWDVDTSEHVPEGLQKYLDDPLDFNSTQDLIMSFFATGRAPSADEAAESQEGAIAAGFAQVRQVDEEEGVAARLAFLLWDRVTLGEPEVLNCLNNVAVLLATTPTFAHVIGFCSAMMVTPNSLEWLNNCPDRLAQIVVQILVDSFCVADTTIGQGTVAQYVYNVTGRATEKSPPPQLKLIKCRCKGGTGTCHVCQTNQWTLGPKLIKGIKVEQGKRMVIDSQETWLQEMEKTLALVETNWSKHITIVPTRGGSNKHLSSQHLTLQEPILDVEKICKDNGITLVRPRGRVTLEEMIQPSIHVLNKILTNVDIS